MVMLIRAMVVNPLKVSGIKITSIFNCSSLFTFKLRATGFGGAHGSAGLGLGHRFVNGGVKGPQQGATKLIWFFGKLFGFKLLFP